MVQMEGDGLALTDLSTPGIVMLTALLNGASGGREVRLDIL